MKAMVQTRICDQQFPTQLGIFDSLDYFDNQSKHWVSYCKDEMSYHQVRYGKLCPHIVFGPTRALVLFYIPLFSALHPYYYLLLVPPCKIRLNSYGMVNGFLFAFSWNYISSWLYNQEVEASSSKIAFTENDQIYQHWQSFHSFFDCITMSWIDWLRTNMTWLGQHNYLANYIIVRHLTGTTCMISGAWFCLLGWHALAGAPNI
jgi:hypothetical protein